MPFSTKLMPAALPAFTTISWAARTAVCAGAIRVSWATGLPSAVRETHVVSSARMSSVKVLGGFAVAARVVALADGRLASGPVAGLRAEPAVDAVGDAAVDAGSMWGGVVAAEIVRDDFPTGGVPAFADDGAVAGAGD